ncbi:hypothetical protein J4E93_001750 [Alternaria ventricosa]|uniref:uncharacterized protein n=1 Tax=Alternaria ventricosa TaxID=1187951 RepID=UPI0020C5657D|nr:uncharacterized protein J4E93_001750 [Alternaria ventricosa]KAI4653982.1 hypothetical protein J4E93_001750 [Alternaria ventricosa]
MSFTFQVQKINQSFDQIAAWYHEFMRRTELCFRKMHERILVLEQRQNIQGPTDEQVERVLRKILDERFSDLATHHVRKHDTTQDRSWFVKDPNDLPYPRPMKMDVASLLIQPDAVPSKAYSETFRMLEDGLRSFPVDHSMDSDDEEDYKINVGIRDGRSSRSV